MARLEASSDFPSPLNFDQPFSRVVVILCTLDASAHPYIELHQTGVGFEPVSDFVFWSEIRPVGREGQVCHVGVVHRVVSDQCLVQSVTESTGSFASTYSISKAPIVANAFVLIHDQARHAKCL